MLAGGLRIRESKRGQHMSSGREHAAVMLVPRNVRDLFPVDQQSNGQIGPKIRGALHNQPPGWMSAT